MNPTKVASTTRAVVRVGFLCNPKSLGGRIRDLASYGQESDYIA